MATLYKPYVSDSSDSESSEDGYTSEESLINTPGKDAIEVVPSGSKRSVKSDANTIEGSGTKFETMESKNTSLFMINSRDRDNRVYPQPTFFTMRLPHVYKNVKTVNVAQINLLNSFFNFSVANGNTNMYVQEETRNPVNVQIRQGTYGVNDLVTELGSALNSTPLFADIDFQTFLNEFQTTGDYTPLFNVPGPAVYNSLTQSYEYGKTIDDIVARYFQQNQQVGVISYTANQTNVAYYYPIVKEMTIQNIPFSFVNQTLPTTYVSWYDYIVFAFTGLDDPYITPIVLDAGNQVLFNNFHYQNTFNASLLNLYNCSYNTKQGRLTINSPSLNQSIVNDLTTQYNLILTSLIYDENYTSLTQFNNAYAEVLNLNGVLLGFFNFMQSQFANAFAVNFGQYSLDYYVNSNNPITIYNNINKYGWSTSLTPQVATSVISNVQPPSQSPILWDNITFVNNSAYTFVSTVKFSEDGVLNFPNAGDANYGFIDVQFQINPTSYTQAMFQSKTRQSLSIMTLPRYTNNKTTSTNMVYDITNAKFLFNGSNNSILTDPIDQNFNLYTVFQSMFHSADYMRESNKWINYLFSQILSGKPQFPYTPFAPLPLNPPSFPQDPEVPLTPPFYNNPPINDVSLKDYRAYFFIQVNADKYILNPEARFKISLHVESQTDKNFNEPILITWYKDRAGFMADVKSVMNGGHESGRHFFEQTTAFTNESKKEFVVTVNNSQTTYFIIRPSQTMSVALEPLRIFCNLTEKYGTYTNKTLVDTYDMPFSPLSSIYDQFTPESDVFKYPLTSIYDSNIFKLGYDVSGVSNNVLDYYIQAGNNRYYDPTNLRYVMNATEGASGPPPNISSPTQWSLYFGSTNSFIQDLSTNTIYMSTNTNKQLLTKNQFNMVNWFLAGSAGEPIERFNQPSTISTNAMFLPCINPLQRLPTDISTNLINDTYDLSGFSGLGLYFPPNEYISLQSIVLKFAYTQQSENSTRTTPIVASTNQSFLNAVSHTETKKSPANSWDDWYTTNRRNTKVGIFLASTINNIEISNIRIESSICTLSLESVSQVNNYIDQRGTLKTREPEWGTYYTYSFNTSTLSVWDISTNVWEVSPNNSNVWFSTTTFPDFAPSTNIGFVSYPNVFETPTLQNYTYLPRSFGVAASIANSTIQSIHDFNNSYVVIPFFKDPTDKIWKVGNFSGVTYTKVPCLPSISLQGKATYYGPPGGFGWFSNTNDTSIKNIMISDNTFYYWNANVNFHNLEINYDPATDLNAFGGAKGIENEYQDTFLLAYDSYGAAVSDISFVNKSDFQTYNVWGQESSTRYKAFDDQSGYNFLSYIHAFPVQVSNQYFVNVRAYDPIPSFTTGLRIIGKNSTDFGSPTFHQIALEISSISVPSIHIPYVHISDNLAKSFITNLYKDPPDVSSYKIQISTNDAARNNLFSLSHEYADSLIDFNNLFTANKQTFGKTLTYRGSTFTFTSYQDAYTQFLNIYNSVIPTYKSMLNILSNANSELRAYANEKYSGILPAFALERNTITDPLPFQLMFSTYINPAYANQYDSWGLGYNLGFNKADTPTQPRTIVVADTFIRIVQDYIYLKINPELNMNKLAVSNKEDLSETHDPSAEDSKYFSKILLNDFASYCRAAVQLPVQFTQVLGKLDTISFQLLDKNGNQIDNVDCEYDVVLEVTEIQQVQTDNSSMIKPESKK